MEINDHFASAPVHGGHANGAARAHQPVETNETAETAGSDGPAYVIDIRSTQDDGGDAPSHGKSAESPAHQARAFIAQFATLSGQEGSPFKAFGKIVSQIAQGRSFDEIFAAHLPEPEAPDGEPAATAAEIVETPDGDIPDAGTQAAAVELIDKAEDTVDVTDILRDAIDEPDRS